MQDVRCSRCAKLLARARHFDAIEIKCPRCGTFNSLRAVPSPLPESQGAPYENDHARQSHSLHASSQRCAASAAHPAGCKR
ncbi:Com family DNA-binding transcriptional regulator [Dyella acidisoli]|uniref:Com family DNA-binding transcriptional regulator n=1 Tax=Dyella acidisoli TaxID=1867834 RepID=UPI0024E0CFCD|nr:Com family DNA-binding transcriptional regulator [Dyella acidisoli]